MPKHIKTEHIERMFPFEFYDELNEKLVDYTLTNPAFLANAKTPLTKERRAEIFQASRTEAIFATIHKNNLIEAEPFGELLHLDLCTKSDHAEKLVGNATERSQVPLSILVGQLYDSSGEPVFAKDVTEETIAQIPEILYDDPNLLLAVIEFGEAEATVGVIQMPKNIEEKLLSPVEDDTDENA